MKKLLCVLLALMLVFLAGCGISREELQEKLNDPQIQATTEAVLDHMLAGDVDSAWLLAASAGTKEQFADFYSQVKPLLEGIDTYTLEPYHVNFNTTNGVSTKSLRYLLTSGDTQLWVTATTQEGVDSLVGFQIYMVTTETGTLGTAGENDPAQWVFLVIGLLEMAFIVVVLIDCIRNKMKRKWLWILVVLLGLYLLLVVRYRAKRRAYMRRLANARLAHIDLDDEDEVLAAKLGYAEPEPAELPHTDIADDDDDRVPNTDLDEDE